MSSIGTRICDCPDTSTGHGSKPAGDLRAFDARQVMANLAPKIVRDVLKKG